jgi:hypothetical protein
VSGACARHDARHAACDLVIAYYQAINTGRHRQAWAMLGQGLRPETGGPDCPHLLAFAEKQLQPTERERSPILPDLERPSSRKSITLRTKAAAPVLV